MRRTPRRRVLALGVGAPLLVSGCAQLLVGSGPPSPTVYRLTPKVALPPRLPRADWVLVVAEPTAEGALDTTRVAILTDGARVDRLADVAWSDRPTAMLQLAMVQAFQTSGRVPAVGTDRDDLRGSFLLQSTLDAFQLEPEATGYMANVRLHARLLRLPSREIADSRSFTQRVPAASGTNDAAIAAFNTAVGGVLDELVVWTVAGKSGNKPRS